jgi:hypothetical protein
MVGALDIPRHHFMMFSMSRTRALVRRHADDQRQLALS